MYTLHNQYNTAYMLLLINFIKLTYIKIEWYVMTVSVIVLYSKYSWYVNRHNKTCLHVHHNCTYVVLITWCLCYLYGNVNGMVYVLCICTVLCIILVYVYMYSMCIVYYGIITCVCTCTFTLTVCVNKQD